MFSEGATKPHLEQAEGGIKSKRDTVIEMHVIDNPEWAKHKRGYVSSSTFYYGRKLYLKIHKQWFLKMGILRIFQISLKFI